MTDSKTIWKYPLKLTEEQIVEMPANAHVLCVQTQYGVPNLWALVDPVNLPEARKFLTFETGHVNTALAGLVNYIGTFQIAQGHLVYHVFENIIYGAVQPLHPAVETAAPTQEELLPAG